ncbi:MAG: lysophospholipid acyltransferase family protein [Rhodospirillales bacterium]|nr:lysophospholipid acyltransferase family protein [Rhodospirillales bacterium]
MRLLKRIAKSAWFQGVLCRLAAQYIRLVHATGRWEVIGGDIPARYWDTGRPFIFAFWHGRLLLMAHAWRRGLPIHMLTSQHRDGQLIGRTMGAFGVEMVIGSTTRGGATALRGMVRLLKAGQYVGITPDGPRGPRMRATPGVVQVAKLSGAPIIPAAYSAARCRRLGSWDRFMVPLPFSRGVFVWGRPIEVAPDASEAALEALREEVENRLNALTFAADQRMGQPAVEPAPWPAADGGAAVS